MFEEKKIVSLSRISTLTVWKILGDQKSSCIEMLLHLEDISLCKIIINFQKVPVQSYI